MLTASKMNNATHEYAENARFARAFSLIELLVVLAIIGLLLLVAVPIFSNSTSNARQTSREMIKAQIRQARAHAIASGNPTAVAIPTFSAGKELGVRSISLFEVKLENGKYIPLKDAQGNDLQLERTAILPGSFHFVPAVSISSSNSTLVDLPETMTTSFRGQEHECHFIVFASNGQIVRPAPGTPINIAIAQAARSGDSLILTEKSGGSVVFEYFQINRLTGKTRFVEP
jgi:prepilin-type N-terminal cleavage/methylation domain-containing protein